MTKKENIYPVSAIPLIIFILFSFSACQLPTAQMQSGNEILPANKSIKVKPTSNPEIRLNGLNMGTTRNLSILSNRLKRVFKERERNGTFRENTNEIERTVFIDAVPSLKVSEIAKVIRALEDSGVSPLMLPIEINGTTEWNWATSNTNVPPVENVKPNPLMLIVTIGKLTSETPVDAKGIVLRLNQTTIPHKDSVDLDGLVVDIGKEGEYLINGKSIKKTALEDIFRTFLREVASEDSKYIIVNLENNADKISFGSVLDIAREAYNVGVKELELKIYFPSV
jgi:biopolymer transport protein ExbD